MKGFLNQIGMCVGMACAGVACGQEPIGTSLFDQTLVNAEEPIRLVSCESELVSTPIHCAPAARSQFSVDAEMPLLSVYANHGSGGSNNSWFNEFDTNAALRFTAAYQSAGIMGVRGRFFTYDTTGSGTPVDRFDLRLYDIEATTGLNIHDWNLLGFGGLRWGDIEYSNRFSISSENFDGFGLTLGGDIRRNVGCGVAFVGGVRQSYLYGETTANPFVNTLANVIVPITELRIGAEYGIGLRGGSRLIAGIGYEHQQFNSLTVRNIAIDPEDVDVALAGPVFSLTWLR